jgi:FMN phosphatase YigB (HAD superfamily)
MVKALLLDLGNVLLELDFRRMLSAIGLPPSATETAAMTGLDRLEIFDAFERGTLGEADFVRALLPALPRPLTFAEFEAAWNTIFVREVEGIGELLKRVRAKLPLYALTNANPMHMRRAMEFPVMAHFHRIFTSYDLGCRKPERCIYEKVCAQIGLESREILFLDDREENVEGARLAGLPAALVFRSADAVLEHLKAHGVVL